MNNTTGKKTAQKTCPKCNNIVADNVTECNECGYKFENKPISPKAPRKPCPKCGNKVPIRAVACNVCDYQFPFKDGTTAKTQRKPKPSSNSQSNSTANPIVSSPVKKDGRNPFKTLIFIVISLVIYNAILIFAMAWLYRSGNGAIWFALITTASILLSAFVGGVIGHMCAESYGENSLGACWIYLLVGIGGTLLADYLYFKNGLPAYSDFWKWGMGAFAISISASIVICLISLYLSLKDTYCTYCCLTNVLSYSHAENTKESYGYEFKTHKAYTETARGRVSNGLGDSADINVNYTVPEYQENLGLHKYTTEDHVYVCKKCGRKATRKFSSKEKV